MSIRKCPNCNSEIGNWDFCFHCCVNLNEQNITDYQEPTTDILFKEETVAEETTTTNQRDIKNAYPKQCPNYGQEVGDWTFCFYCGTNLKAQSVAELPEKEAEQQGLSQDSISDGSIEGELQEVVEVNAPVCPNCGKEIGEWDFCFHCGANLKASPVVEQTDEEFEIIKSLVSNETASAVPEPKNESNTDSEELPEAQNDNIIVLEDENGNSVEFEFLDLIQYRGKEYVVLLPNDDSIEKVIILQLEETSDGTESYLSVDNEYTLQVVFEIFKERAKNEFNFID